MRLSGVLQRIYAALDSPRVRYPLIGLVYPCLAGLLAVPLVTLRRTTQQERYIRSVLGVAGDQMTQVERAIVVLTSTLAAEPELAEPDSRAAFVAAVAQERLAYSRMAPVLNQLPDRIGPRIQALHDLTSAEVDPVVANQLPGDAQQRQAEQPNDVQVRYLRLITEAQSINDEIALMLEQQRESVIQDSDRGLMVMLGLAGLAGASALVVLLLGIRLRTLAEIAERRRAEVERLSEVRARLVRGVTHDLKNPLGAASTYGQMLEQGMAGPLPDEQRGFIANINRLIGTTLTMIDDLLGLAQAESDQLPMKWASEDIVELTRAAVADMAPQASAAGLMLRAELPDRLPALVTDRRRVQQVLGNLLSNAVKYTPRGGRIVVRTGTSNGATPEMERPAVWISVSDSGPGIPPDQQDRIFQEFVRLGDKDTRPGGAGLGLAISRAIARRLGGDLELDSKVGAGSTFTLWLPLRQVG